MISQLEHPAVERGLGGPPGAGGGISPRVTHRPARLDHLRGGVEGFCVEWQLLESPPGAVEPATRTSPPRAVGGTRA